MARYSTKWFVRLAFLVLGSSGSLAAQGTSFGAQASYGSETDFGVGAGISVPLASGSLPLRLAASFDYFFPAGESAAGGGVSVEADLNYWEINGNVLVDVPVSGGSIAPYVGAGANFYRTSGGVTVDFMGEEFGASGSESKVGLNLVGGLRFGSGGPTPRLEVRYATGVEQFVVAAGVSF